MLLHLAMLLSEVSGWRIPSDDKAHDSSHESAITGEVDSARDRRRLDDDDDHSDASGSGSSCDDSWSVPPAPRLSSSLV